MAAISAASAAPPLPSDFSQSLYSCGSEPNIYVSDLLLYNFKEIWGEIKTAECAVMRVDQPRLHSSALF